MLGDEGSGSYLGKLLIKKLFYRELTDDLEKKFNLKYGYSKEDILDALYNKPHVNVFLSNLSKFYFENIEHPLIRAMIKKAFTDFFESHVVKYKHHKSYPINFVGSVGFVFKDVLSEVASDFHVKLGNVMKNPVEALVKYHSETAISNVF